jgi:Histidinol-phosphate/aromatic aminotransferase and cobyric acid decarboxylase
VITLEHGGDVYTEGIFKGKELVDFSSNINPLGVPISFKENINEALESMERYPDVKYRNVKKHLKNYMKFSSSYFDSENQSLQKFIIDEEDIVLGNGAAEIIDLAISCFKNICIVVPSFIEYEKNAVKWGCQIEYSYLKKDMNFDYKDILSKMKNSEALIIGNPNNPNGNVIDKDKFKVIMDYCQKNNKVILVDEAFSEFTGKKGFTLLKDMENYHCIFIIKALTKFYAMPGIRMGYGVSKNRELIEKIQEKQNPWNINCFAEVAVKYVLKDQQYIEESLKWIEEERSFITHKLKNIDFIEKVYTTYSNFVLCKLKNIDCHKLYDLCLEKGIVIRKCDNFKGLNEEYVRFAIKDRQSNEKLIEALNSINKF